MYVLISLRYLSFDFSYNTTVEGGTTYYVNLCGKAKECEEDVSVCDSNKNMIASYKQQTIMAEGKSSD